MSGGTTMNAGPVDYSDVQGLVRFGHKHLTEACFLLLQVENAAAVRSWLAAAPISTAESAASLPDAALHIAFTSDGLRALGVAQELIQRFSAEFIAGMAGEDSRS